MTSVLSWRSYSACLGIAVALWALPFQAFGAEDLDATSGEATSQADTQTELTATSASTVVGDFTVVGGQLGVDYQFEGSSLYIYTDAALTISGTSTMQNIVVPQGVSANITLDGVNIDVSDQEGMAGILVQGSANIILAENSSNGLSGSYRTSSRAGLQVDAGGDITIDGTGSLVARGGYSSAGIGGGYESYSGTITINGGTISAHSAWEGAGIGGGYGSDDVSGGTVIINGGTIEAYSVADGAGIGGGYQGASGTIIITGGTVDASSGSGAGIGGGLRGSAESITISGGTVSASSTSGAGIGAGYQGHSGGSFTTTDTGSAVIKASSIADTSQKSSWSGIIFLGDEGTVYSAPVIGENFTIDEDETLTIAESQTLEISSLGSLANSGILNIEGALISEGTITNNSTVTNTSTFTNRGTLTNNATLTNTSTLTNEGTLTNTATFNNEGSLTNSGTLAITDSATLLNIATIDNTGTLTNEGTLTNNGTFTSTQTIAGSGIFKTTIFTADDIEDIDDQLYNGSAIEPQLTFIPQIIGGKTFNYYLNGWTQTYANNVNSGVASVIYTHDDYDDVVKTFNIVTLIGDFHVLGGALNVDYTFDKDTYSLVILTDTPLTITGTSTTQYISIPEGVTANITLDGVTIDASNLENTPAVEVLGTANITLAENSTSTLIGGKYAAGIQVEVGAEVTIDGEGTLDVTGGSTSAGIGGGRQDGNSSNDAGAITINGGYINATGGVSGAGIGGAYDGNGGIITITGGVVYAQGGSNASGIGGGYFGDGGTIVISAGTVIAIGGGNAAGIGDDQMGLVPSTFSTTQDGTAIIEASSISDQSSKSLWSGIIFEGSTGEVYGDQAITGTYIIETSQTLTIQNDASLTVSAGAILINEGTLINRGTFNVYGIFAGDGEYIEIPSSVTITFVANGGEVDVETITIDKGSVLIQFPEATLAGHTFKGWFLDQEFTQAFDLSAAISQDITVYAAYEPVDDTTSGDQASDPATDPATDQAETQDAESSTGITQSQLAQTGDFPVVYILGITLAASLATALIVFARRKTQG